MSQFSEYGQHLRRLHLDSHSVSGFVEKRQRLANASNETVNKLYVTNLFPAIEDDKDGAVEDGNIVFLRKEFLRNDGNQTRYSSSLNGLYVNIKCVQDAQKKLNQLFVAVQLDGDEPEAERLPELNGRGMVVGEDVSRFMDWANSKHKFGDLAKLFRTLILMEAIVVSGFAQLNVTRSQLRDNTAADQQLSVQTRGLTTTVNTGAKPIKWGDQVYAVAPDYTHNESMIRINQDAVVSRTRRLLEPVPLSELKNIVFGAYNSSHRVRVQPLFVHDIIIKAFFEPMYVGMSVTAHAESGVRYDIVRSF